MWERVFEIVKKEFRQTLREPRMRGVLIGPRSGIQYVQRMLQASVSEMRR